MLPVFLLFSVIISVQACPSTNLPAVRQWAIIVRSGESAVLSCNDTEYPLQTTPTGFEPIPLRHNNSQATVCFSWSKCACFFDPPTTSEDILNCSQPIPGNATDISLTINITNAAKDTNAGIYLCTISVKEDFKHLNGSDGSEDYFLYKKRGVNLASGILDDLWKDKYELKVIRGIIGFCVTIAIGFIWAFIYIKYFDVPEEESYTFDHKTSVLADGTTVSKI